MGVGFWENLEEMCPNPNEEQLVNKRELMMLYHIEATTCRLVFQLSQHLPQLFAPQRIDEELGKVSKSALAVREATERFDEFLRKRGRDRAEGEDRELLDRESRRQLERARILSFERPEDPL